MSLRAVVGSATVVPLVYACALRLPAGLAALLAISAMALFAYVEVRRIRSNATVKLRSGDDEIQTSGEVNPIRAADALKSLRNSCGQGGV